MGHLKTYRVVQRYRSGFTFLFSTVYICIYIDIYIYIYVKVKKKGIFKAFINLKTNEKPMVNN